MPTKRKAIVSKKKQKKIKTIDAPLDLRRFTSRAVTVERFADTDKLARTGVSVLHVMVWYNLDPRGVKNAFNLEKARLLYKIIKKDLIDVEKIIWKVVQVASNAEHATVALPYGLLITKILLENDVSVRDGLEGDSWKPQMSAIARGTMGKTQGQSRKHCAGTDPTSLESVAARLDEALALIKKMQSDHKKDMNKFKADVKEMQKALIHCENDSSTNESEDGAESEDGTGGKNEAESDDGTGKEEDGTEGESGYDSEDRDNNEDGDE
ncbi:hypothetical protein RHMOL_Rhmol06G0161300 [Rhododendron molle]|uniref:Uncharacterized protein n=1 Tax=Rhododendron molle TaxID=49168 RepID=A0ACC0NEW3_RHOML|nr:hypothetical protein RHMOL_Rhmol06G0161300 [Rhododendron molle]